MISSITDARVERRKETHAGLISPGLVQALHHVPFHGSGVAPLSRRVLAGPDMHPDRVLLEAADILPLEEVHVWNVTRGTRFCTYAIEGEAGSGVVCVNGAAAHLARAGDVIIVATFTWMDEPAARQHQPRVVLLRNNRIISQDLPEVPGPLRRQWDTVLGPEGR